MQGLNHVVFGSLIGLTIKQPALAVPLALASHFALDVMPHYGNDPKLIWRSRRYHQRILLDGLACTAYIAWLISLHPPNTGLVVLCAFLALLPDLLWPITLYIKDHGLFYAFFKFHKSIQNESRQGIYVEIIWFLVTAGMVYFLATR